MYNYIAGHGKILDDTLNSFFVALGMYHIYIYSRVIAGILPYYIAGHQCTSFANRKRPGLIHNVYYTFVHDQPIMH